MLGNSHSGKSDSRLPWPSVNKFDENCRLRVDFSQLCAPLRKAGVPSLAEIMAMDARRLQEVAGKHACEARANFVSEHILQCRNAKFTSRCESSQLMRAGFDDDCDWSDDPYTNASASTLSVKTHSTQLNGLDSCYIH